MRSTSACNEAAIRSARSMRGQTACPPSSSLAGVDVHHAAQELDGLVARPLEGVAAHDRAERAAVAQAADLGEDLVGALGLAAGEDDDPLAVEAALHDVSGAVGEGLPRDRVLLEHLLRLGLVDELAR